MERDALSTARRSSRVGENNHTIKCADGRESVSSAFLNFGTQGRWPANMHTSKPGDLIIEAATQLIQTAIVGTA